MKELYVGRMRSQSLRKSGRLFPGGTRGLQKERQESQSLRKSGRLFQFCERVGSVQTDFVAIPS